MKQIANSNKMNSREKGSSAEALAIAYLKSKNFRIIKQNFYFGRYGEIDIIAKDGNVLVFVEVKSKSSKSSVNPIESINYKKQKHLKRAAEGYLYVNNIYEQECRFDVIIIDFTIEPPSIEHIIQAFN
jgi:putative endonuclease